MSSAENGKLVWITRERRYAAEAASILAGAQNEQGERTSPAAREFLDGLVKAWDAAPADPAEAVFVVLRDSIDEWGEAEWTHVWSKAVLAALGVPNPSE